MESEVGKILKLERFKVGCSKLEITVRSLKEPSKVGKNREKFEKPFEVGKNQLKLKRTFKNWKDCDAVGKINRS